MHLLWQSYFRFKKQLKIETNYFVLFKLNKKIQHCFFKSCHLSCLVKVFIIIQLIFVLWSIDFDWHQVALIIISLCLSLNVLSYCNSDYKYHNVYKPKFSNLIDEKLFSYTNRNMSYVNEYCTLKHYFFFKMDFYKQQLKRTVSYKKKS